MMRGAAHEYRIEVGTTSSTGAGRLPFQFVHRLLLLCTTRDTLHKKKHTMIDFEPLVASWYLFVLGRDVKKSEYKKKKLFHSNRFFMNDYFIKRNRLSY